MLDEGTLPEALAGRPELDDGILPFWQAFRDLARDRPLGMAGAGPIPWSSLIRYLDEHGIAGRDDRDEFIELVTATDDAFLARQQQRRDRRER